MGDVLMLSCPSCWFQVRVLVGTGFMSSFEYYKNTVNDKYEKRIRTIKAFLDDYPDGRITIDETIAVCQSCGAFRRVKEMGMYILTDKKCFAMSMGIQFLME